MTIRNQIALLLFIPLFFLAASCRKNANETSLTFPAKFIFVGQEIEESSFYVKTGTGFEEVLPAGFFAQIDSLFLEDLQSIPMDFPIAEIEFLSNSSVIVRVVDEFGNSEDLPATYTQTDDLLEVELGFSDPMILHKNSNFDQLKICLLGYLYSYFDDFFQQRKYSPFFIDDCDFSDTFQALEMTDENNELEIGDTVAVNYSYLVFEME